MIRVIPDTVYYMRVDDSASGGFGRICFYDIDGNFTSTINISGNKYYTLTIPSDAYYMAFDLQSVYGTTYNHDISINYPATDTDYHAYNSTTATISFGSAGTVYGGYVDLISGELIVDRAMVNLGSLTWSYTSSSQQFYVSYNTITNAPKIPPTNVKANAICSNYEVVARDNATNLTFCIATNGNFVIYDNNYTDATTFKNAMDGVQLVYELATPQTYQLTPTQLRSLVGTNNLTSSTGEVTEVEYITNSTIAWLDDKIEKIDLEPDTSVTNVISFSFEKPKRDCRFYFQVFDKYNEKLIFEASAPLNLDTMDITATYQFSKFPQYSSEWYCDEGSFVLDVGNTVVIEISIPAIYKMKSYIKYVVDGSQPDYYDFLSIIIGNLGANAVIKGYLK